MRTGISYSKIDDFDEAENILSKELIKIYLPLEKFYKYLSLKTKLNYIGMDLSFAPGIEKKSSVFESFLILFLSPVCGYGLDTIPLPFEVKNEFLEYLILDSFTISKKWKKLLQVRLLPVKAKNSTADFNLKYLLKSKFLDY